MTLYEEEPEVRTRLEEVGIPLEALQRAARRGAGGYTSTTTFHPVSSAGTYLYHEATAALRLELVPGGDWGLDEEDHQPRVFSEKYRAIVVVLTGDKYTGIDGPQEPRSRNAKGGATRKKIDENQGQLHLFDISPTGIERSAEKGGMLTWVFLIAIVDGEIRSELSLPNELDDESRPSGYHERILLPAQPLDGTLPTMDKRGDDDEGPVADIDVSWK